jgi:hypothetical protein
MKNNLNLIAFLLIVITYSTFLLGCKNEDSPESKPIENKNYRSITTCNVDGKAWSDCYPMMGKSSNSTGQWYKSAIGTPLRLYFTSGCDSPFIDINISLSVFSGVGSYSVSTDSYAEYEIYYPIDRIRYRTNLSSTGTVSITKFDTSRQEISGKYEFKVYNSDSNKTKTITNGQFDRVRFSII